MPEGAEMTDLSLVPLDELIEEMRKRSDTLIIAYTKSLNKENEEVYFRYFGSKFTALGMVAHFQDKIAGELFEISEE